MIVQGRLLPERFVRGTAVILNRLSAGGEWAPTS